MERRDFIRTCGLACAGGLAAAALQGCATQKMAVGTITGEYLTLGLSAFRSMKKGETVYRRSVVVHNDALQFPVCIYRFGETDFTALYLQCTHQGAALQVFGDKLQCPAHGSEFSNHGEVESGPAALKLRTFPVRIEGDQLKIRLV